MGSGKWFWIKGLTLPLHPRPHPRHLLPLRLRLPHRPLLPAGPGRTAGLSRRAASAGGVDRPPLAGALPGAPSRPVAPPSCGQRPPGPITGRLRPVPALPLPMEFECFRTIQSRGPGTWRCALVAKVARAGWRVASRRDQSARSGAPLLGRAQTAAGAAAALNCGGERVLSWRSAALRWSPPALREPEPRELASQQPGFGRLPPDPCRRLTVSERAVGRGLRAAVRLGAARSGGDRHREWAGAPRYAARLAVSSDGALIEGVSAVSGALPPAFPWGGGACGTCLRRGPSPWGGAGRRQSRGAAPSAEPGSSPVRLLTPAASQSWWALPVRRWSLVFFWGNFSLTNNLWAVLVSGENKPVPDPPGAESLQQ